MSMPDRIWAHVRNLYGLMTPENSTWNTCERGTEYVRADIVDAKDAEIERLRKALEQALAYGYARVWREHQIPDIPTDIPRSSPHAIMHGDEITWVSEAPELADYLRERDNRPPSDGVQSGVQHPEEGGKSA